MMADTVCVHSVSEIPPSMGGLKTCGTDPTTDCSLQCLAKKSPLMMQNDDFCVIGGFFSRQKIHESLVSGGYGGGKHGNSKILHVFY